MKKQYALDYEKYIDVNGDKQNIRVLSTKQDAPVILFLHGGPGVCNRHLVLKHNLPLADDYILVCWDQRASGKSFRKAQLKEQLNTDMYINDTVAVIEYLCKHFNKDKIFVVGHSWGSFLGAIVAQRIPHRIAAYIGVGQLVNGVENERLSYEFCLREAKAKNDTKALSKLQNAPINGKYESHKDMMSQRDYLTKYGGEDYSHRGGLVQTLLLPLLKSKEYSLKQIVAYARGALYQTDVLWAEVIACEFDKTITALEMPVLITQGAHDYNTPFELAHSWLDNLTAPLKKYVQFDLSAHSPIYEEAEKWNKIVNEFLLQNASRVQD